MTPNMTFESAQTHYEGQKGWNDLAPEALDLAMAAKARGKVRPRRVATPLHGLEIPDVNKPTIASKPPGSRAMPPPPPMARVYPPSMEHSANSAPPAASTATTNSRPPPASMAVNSRPPPPPPASTAANSRPPPPPAASMAANSRPPLSDSAAESPSQSAITANSESDLSRINELYSRLLKAPTRLSDSEKQSCIQKFDPHLPKLSSQHLTFIHNVLETALSNKNEARQMLVQYSLVNSNVSPWTVPLRRLVDQQL